MNDIRHIVDYFILLGYSPTPVTNSTGAKRVKGVRASCIGDCQMLGKPEFEEIQVYSSDSILPGMMPPTLQVESAFPPSRSGVHQT